MRVGTTSRMWPAMLLVLAATVAIARSSDPYEAQRMALLPDPEGAVRHVHVRHAQVGEGIDHRVADGGDAADFR